MSRRNLAQPGLSYVEANAGRVSVYTFEQDVVDARKRIEEYYHGAVRVLWDNETHEHLFLGVDVQGTEYLIFATPNFNENEIRARLDQADESKTKETVWDDIDRYNQRVEAEQDAVFSDQVGDIGEKLAWAFAKDGLTIRPKVFIGEGIANR